jgi:hypothetical protein
MKCKNCGFIDEQGKELNVSFVGVGDSPCWRIKWGTIDSFWWGPESPTEACYKMLHNWTDWTPYVSDKYEFARAIKLINT